jgi:processive 1,2-diacylglycerol beta-glucosyltransferase
VIQLRDADSDNPLGSITEAQLQFLMDQLEEESLSDRDYYIAGPTIDMMEEEGADPALVALLRSAVAGREGVNVRWAKN